MGYYPVISTELTRRKWGLAGSRQRLERASKSLMIKSEQEFRLIGQVFREQQEELWHANLRLTSDGSRTICTSANVGCRSMITISENYPNIRDAEGESKKVRYSLQPGVTNDDIYPYTVFGVYDFAFNKNETEIIYTTKYGIFSIDLETGKITEGPKGNYNRGLFQFHRDSILVANIESRTLKRIAPTNQLNNRHIQQCQELCGFQEASLNNSRSRRLNMDVNPLDYSTLAVVGADNRVYLYDVRKFHSSCLWWPSEPLVKLGDEEHLLSLELDSYYSGRVRFSPSGGKIATAVMRDFGGNYFIIVHDVNGQANQSSQEVAFDGGDFSWYDEEHLCFVKADMMLSWSVKTGKICRLFPAYAKGVYAHPKLPIIANYDVNCRPRTAHMFKIWSI